MTKQNSKKSIYMKKGFTALLIANVLASPMITNFAPQIGMAAESDLQSKSISTMANTTGAAAIDDPVRMPVISNVMDSLISDYGVFGFNATPGSTVYITFGSITRTATVSATGYWELTKNIPDNMPVGTKVTAYAVLNGVYSKTDTTYVKTAIRGSGTTGDGKIAIPIVKKPVTNRDTSISIGAGYSSTVYANINGKIYSAPASAGSISIPKQAPGTEIILYATIGSHTGYLGRTVVLYEEGPQLATPTINTVKDNQKIVTGTAEPNTTLTLYVNGSAVGTGAVGSNGQYSITMNSTYPVGTTIQAKSVNSDGDESPYGSTKVVTSVTLAAPTINTVKNTDTVVTGTSTPNTQIVLTINGTQYTGTTGSNGQYSVTIPKQAVGTLVTAQAKNGTDSSPTTSTTVIAGTIATPTINTVTTDDTLVKGTAPANSKVTLTIPQDDGSTKTWTGTADASGNYSISIAKQAVGTKIEVTAEKDGITSAKASTTVIQGALKTPTINGLTTKDTLVTGTAEPNASITLRIPQGDGSYLSFTGTSDASGNYAISIPAQAAGTTVEVGSSKNNLSSAKASTVVTQGDIAAPTVNTVTDQDTVVTGKTEPSATVKVKIPQTGGGSLTFEGTSDASGNYSVPISKQAAGTTIEVTAEKGGLTSAKGTTLVVRTAIPAPTINEVSDKDTVVTGKTEPNADVTLAIPQAGGGSLTYTGKADASGNYTITIPKQKAGQPIQVTVTLDGKTSPTESTTVVDKTAPDAPVLLPINDQQEGASGTTEPYATVELTVDGMKIGEGKAGSNGDFWIAIPKQTEGKQVVATAKDAAGNISTPSSVIVTGTKIATPTINTVSDKDTIVTGKTEPGATVTLTIPQAGGGSLTYTGTADASGNYAITIAKQTAGTVISAVATLGSKTSDKASTTVVDKTAPDVTLSPIADDQALATGQTEASAAVKIYANDVLIAQGTAGSNGQYSITIPKQAAGVVVKATATDAAGNVSTPASVTVTATAIPTPTIDTVGDSDTLVTGKTEPNADVKLTIPQAGGGSLVYTGKADASGNYAVAIAKQSAGTEIQVVATVGSKTSAAASTIVVDKTAPTVTLNAVNEDQTSVTGQTEANAAVKIYVNEVLIAQGTAGADGKYTITIPKQAAGVTVKATATDTAGNVSTPASQVVTSVPLKDPTINKVIDTDTAVTGTADPNATVTLRIPQKDGSALVYTGTANSSGNYSITISKQAAGTVIEATSSLNGKTSNTVSTTVQASPVDYTLTAQASYTIGAGNISGTYGKDIATVNVLVNGTVVGQATLSNGNYTFSGLNTYIKKKTDTLQVVGLDSSGTEQARKSITITGNDVMDYSLTAPANYTIGSNSINGTYGEDIAKVNVLVNGKVIGQATVNNGSYTFTNLNNFIAKKTDTLQVVGLDSSGAEQARKSITVIGDDVMDYSLTVPASYTVGTSTISGTYGKDISKVRVWVNGVVVGQATTDGNGNYTFSGMEKFVFKKTDKVEVVGVDSRYVEQARKPVTVVGNDVMDYDLTVQQNPYVIGTSTSLTGTYGDDISKVRLFVNGKVVAQATTDSNGNYTFATAAQFITSSTDTVKVVGVDSAYVQRAEKPVTVQGNVQYDYSLSADPYKLNQANLTGKYGKDIFKVRLVVNGTIVRQAEMDGNGNFTFPNVATFIQPGDTVELVGVDSRYQEQKRIPVNVDDSMNFDLTVNQNPYIIGTSTALTGTYGKDLSRVRLSVNGKVVAQAQTDGAGNYNFPNAAQFITSNSDVVKVLGVDSTFAQRAETPVNVQGGLVYDYSLTADPYTLNQTNLTGKYGKDIFKVRLVVNGTIVRQAEMDGNGNYTFPNIASYIKPSDKVELVGVDSRYQEQKRIPVTVTDATDYKLTVVQNPYIVGTSKAITGTYGKDISKVRLFVNGTVVAQATTDSAGNYSFANAAQYIKSDQDVVKVVGVDSSYVQRAEVAVPVQGSIVYDYALTVDPYRLNQANLTGTYGKDIARVRLFINGVVVRQAEVDGNGNYTFPNIGSSIKAGDKVEVVGVDSRFVEQQRIPLSVNENLDYALTVAENPYTIGTSTALSGTYGEDINQVRLVVNGTVVTQAQLDGSGNYTIPNAAQFIKAATDNVQVVGVDKQFVQQASQTVNLASKPVDYALTAPASYELKGKQITGTYGKDLTAVRLLVNGEMKVQAQLDGNGNYTFNNVDSFITSGTDQVVVVGVDSTYQEQARKTIAVTVPKDYTLTQDSYKIGQDALTGKYGADIKAVRLYKDGVLLVNRNVDGSGSFTFPEAYAQIKDDGANYEIVGVDASNVDQIRIPVVVSGSLDFAATANPYTLGDATITGTVGADVKRLQLVVNGTVKRLGTISGSTFSVSGAGIVAGDKVEIYAQDSHFITRTVITVQ